MSAYVVSPSAQDDIRGIADHIAHDSIKNAEKVVSRLYAQFERLAEFPGLGHTRAELKDDTLRVISVYKYLVIYDGSVRPIQILRVVHGARNLHWIRPR